MRYHTAVSQYPRGIVIINNRSQRKVSKVYFLIGTVDIQIYTTESSNSKRWICRCRQAWDWSRCSLLDQRWLQFLGWGRICTALRLDPDLCEKVGIWIQICQTDADQSDLDPSIWCGSAPTTLICTVKQNKNEPWTGSNESDRNFLFVK